jgi:hypothetical protein
MDRADLSTFKLLIFVTSQCARLFDFMMWAVAKRCCNIRLVPCSDGWRRTWFQTTLIMPMLPVYTILQKKYIYHKGTYLWSLPTLVHIVSIFMDAHQALYKVCYIWLLKSQIKTVSFCKEILYNVGSDLMVQIWHLGKLTRETVNCYFLLK